MHCFDTRTKGDLRPGREIQTFAWLDSATWTPRAAPAVQRVLRKRTPTPSLA